MKIAIHSTVYNTRYIVYTILNSIQRLYRQTSTAKNKHRLQKPQHWPRAATKKAASSSDMWTVCSGRCTPHIDNTLEGKTHSVRESVSDSGETNANTATISSPQKTARAPHTHTHPVSSHRKRKIQIKKKTNKKPSPSVDAPSREQRRPRLEHLEIGGRKLRLRKGVRLRSPGRSAPPARGLLRGCGRGRRLCRGFRSPPEEAGEPAPLGGVR